MIVQYYALSSISKLKVTKLMLTLVLVDNKNKSNLIVIYYVLHTDSSRINFYHTMHHYDLRYTGNM